MKFALITLESPEGKRFTVTQEEDPKGNYMDGFESSIKFQWEDGNYSCDCNRAMLTGNATFETAKCGSSWKLISIEFSNLIICIQPDAKIMIENTPDAS